MLAVLLAGCSGEQGSQSIDTETGQVDLAQAQGDGQSAQSVPDNEPVAQVAAEVGPSVVQIQVETSQSGQPGQQQRQGVGSGVIYSSDGYIITNNHVVQSAQQVTVSFADGSTAQAEVVGGYSRADIAVVKVDRTGLPAATFREDPPIQGQLAVAIGSPVGFESTVTAGVVSGLNREIPSRFTRGQQTRSALTDLVQTDAAISPGSSGGALVDRAGEIIGINIAYLPQTRSGQPVEGLGFAIPASTAADIADQLIESGEVTTAYIGITPTDLTPQVAEQLGTSVENGAVVREVRQGSPAAEAGLQRGDIIVGLDDTAIESSGDLFAALRDYAPGDNVQLTIVRNGEQQTVNLTLGEQTPQ